MADRPHVLIESWFPVDTISAECMRERGASSALPPLYFLHVWWARRPLTVSRAAILASVLPAWSSDWPKELKKKFPSEKEYHEWFLKLCGIFGDPVAGRKILAWARAMGKFIPNPYTHPRAYTVSPTEDYLETMRALLQLTWGEDNLSVLDPFSGGGSIPFESLRYGFRTFANELNPVASVILKGTLEYPAKYGTDLGKDIEKYGDLIVKEVQKRLTPFFTDISESHPDAQGAAYLWARTVKCPYTGKLIPLSPNWWLQKGDNPVAARPIFSAKADKARFEIVFGEEACEKANPDQGTVKRGNSISPWDRNQPVEGDYIKAEAQAGQMGQQLYALAVKGHGGFDFRAPTQQDEDAFEAAVVELEKKLPGWEAKGWVPREPFPAVSNDPRPLHYGMPTWGDFFSPRQLLSLCTFLEVFHTVKEQVFKDLPEDRAKAVVTYLEFMIGKAINYNSRMSVWHPLRVSVANTFDRHDFSFKWSHGEFDASRNLFPWTLDQVTDAYEGIAKLASSDHQESKRLEVNVTNLSAANLAPISDGSIAHICVDPPYYDNVMYAELADFFYVWMKRTLSDVHPQFFHTELTNKDEEAVANKARFKEAAGTKKGKANDLATTDYERKMAGAFREMHRVLRDDGVLTVMFTHKKVEAWDTLATSLIGAGFSIQSSWPVHTESEHSLHQAKKNAAQSTILLTCRKREDSKEPVWWDDIKNEVRRTAREKAEEFQAQGIHGVDLYIATFGPTLSILSQHWPVLTSETDERTGEPKTLRPEVALDLAREEVVNLRMQGLLLGRSLDFDLYTEWYLMAWDAFSAEEFPGDEARKLALAIGLDLEKQVIAQKKLLSKKGKTVVLQQPKARRKKDMVDPDKTAFDCWIDAAHTAMMIYDVDGAQACRVFLNRSGLMNDGTFKACLQALINAIPRTRKKGGKFVRPEAKTLEDIRLAFYDDLEVPPDDEPVKPQELQGQLFDKTFESDFGDDMDEDLDEDSEDGEE